MGKQFKEFAALTLGMALLSACASKPVNYAPLSELRLPVLEARPEYRIGLGDELEVKFFFAPELNDRVTVRPDGKISLMFAQNIQAEGLTADELAQNIRVICAPYVKQLDLVVTVRGFNSQKAYVGGEVAKPGSVPLSGNETIMQVLSGAGWMTTGAKTDKIVVVRRDQMKREKIYLINVDELGRGINMAQNIVVQPGDLILVPPSDIVSADRWVDQNIRQLLPVALSGGVTYNINPDNR
ncbi:MAG: polysaccharide biosynthesis/export family protein [Alphaproteobacteria bacterium]|nr:polysaccharide biosynthesis/export family protein [Alphaproteobacteria bacterium]